MEDKKEKKSMGYRFGYFCGGVLTLCAISLIVAVTVKIIFWMFGF